MNYQSQTQCSTIKHYLTLPFMMLLLIFCSGCSLNTQTSQQYDTQALELGASELGAYWVAKDKLPDWKSLLNDPVGASNYSVSFVINHQGQMQDIIVNELSSGKALEKNALSAFNQYEFFPTARNAGCQAVKVMTTLEYRPFNKRAKAPKSLF